MVKAKKSPNIKNVMKISIADQVSFAKKNRGEAATLKLRFRKKCVTQRTVKQYDGRVERMRTFVKDMGSGYMTKDLFVLFCAGLEDQTGGGTTTAHMYRMALAKAQELEPEFAMLEPGVAPWARDDDMAEITKGYRYQAKEPSDKPKKGVLTRPMLKDFLAWLRKKGLREDAEFAEACHLCGLRISEALRILVGDVIDDDHETKTLLIRGDKRVNAKSDGMEELYPKLLDEDATAFMRNMMTAKKHGDAVFGHMRPKARQQKHRDLYKEAAVALKWPAGLYYDGPHVNRHGWMGMCRQKLGEAVDAAVLQVVKSTKRGYQASTQERLAKRKKN